MSESKPALADEVTSVSNSATEKPDKKGHSAHPSVASSSASTLAGDRGATGRTWHPRSSRASVARTWASASEASRRRLVEEDTSPLVLERFYLWETASKFYVQGTDQSGLRHRILKIDKTLDDDGNLIITQDPATYTRSQVHTLLEQLRKGNASTGGCTRTLECFFGIVGFVRFTGPFYLITIKRRITVAMIGGHYIYHIEETQLTPITGDVPKSKAMEEARLMAAFRSVGLSKNFYYSTCYDLTNTLQSHFTHPTSYSASQSAFPSPPSTSAEPKRKPPGLERRRVAWGFHEKFLWNHHLLEAAFKDSIDDEGRNPWIVPLIYGFVDQSKFCVFGRTVFVLLIARRSRHFAGARFLKRGVSEEGYVANEVEIEQIVSEAMTTALHVPDPHRRGEPGARRPNPRYTSYVQLRGSIPLLWHQDTTHTKAKPPIEFSMADPYFSGAAIHFDDLFTRYGPPVICLNLIKTKERHPREAKLLPQFQQCLSYLSQFLPDPSSLSYLGFDMSAAQRSRQVDVTSYLAGVAEDVIERTRFFHSGPEPASSWFEKGDEMAEEGDEVDRRERRDGPLLQCGVVRTNCIDCLDRTNAAQFCIGKAMLAHQLHALGVLKSRDTPYESDAVDILTNMYHDLGDTVALQYGGSHLVNTIQTYRKTGNQYKSHARDTVEGLKRYYANTFSDNEKQAAIDLFLGIVPAPSDQEAATLVAEMKGRTLLDAVAGDQRPRPVHPKKRSYRKWFDPDHLATAPGSKEAKRLVEQVARKRGEDGYFNLYYRPWLWTALEQHFGSKMNSSAIFGPKGILSVSDRELEELLSPFKKRADPAHKAFDAHRNAHRQREQSSAGGGSAGVANVARWLSNRSLDPQRRRLSRIASEGFPSAKQKAAKNNGGKDGVGAGGAGDDGSDEDDEVVKVVKGTLRPVLKDSELREYDQYIHQFDALRLLETHVSLAHMSDLPIYERAIQLSPFPRDGGGGDDGGQTPAFARMMAEGEAGVEQKDVKLYRESVKVASGAAWPAAAAGGAGAVRGPGRADGGPRGTRKAGWQGSGPPKVRLAPPPPPELDGIGMGLGLALGVPA